MSATKVKKGTESQWANRIVGYGEEDPEQLLANPANWRIHPKPQQDALSGVLAEVGIVQNIIVNKRMSELWGRDQNVETLVDGHLRVSLALSAGQKSIPITYVDLTPAEEAEVLATIDPLSAMAATDKQKLDELLRDVSSGEAAVQAMLAKLAADEGLTKFDPMSEWKGMPEFRQEDQTAYKSLVVHLASPDDMAAFASLIGQVVTEHTRSVWYPKAEIGRYADKRYTDES